MVLLGMPHPSVDAGVFCLVGEDVCFGDSGDLLFGIADDSVSCFVGADEILTAIEDYGCYVVRFPVDYWDCLVVSVTDIVFDEFVTTADDFIDSIGVPVVLIVDIGEVLVLKDLLFHS